MTKEDIPQVNEIDREAFPTQWPPPNYRNELQNQLARYVVVWDDAVTPPGPAANKKGLAGLWAGIKRWLESDSSIGKEISPAEKQYLIGFAGIWVLADEAHVTNIAVRRKYQRRGIGELLLIATIDLAQELKATMLTLEVRASNLTAQSLYRKYGFAEVGVRRAYYVDNREDGILMSTENITSESFQAQLRQLRESLAGKLEKVP
jgi:ribosomal-protein-alanine N-acetyltransferase